MSINNAGISAKQYEKLYREKKEGAVKKAIKLRKPSRKRLTSKPKKGAYSDGAQGAMRGLHDVVVATTSLGEYTNMLLRNEASNIKNKK